jgi:hypothetical protein
LDLNAGNTGEVFQFGDSSLNHWVNGTTLHIADWTGNATSGGGLDQIVFPSVTSLNANELSQIVFDGSGFTHAKLIAVGGGAELVPTNTAPTGLVQYGDVNHDGHVNSADLLALEAALKNVSSYAGSDLSKAIYAADYNYDDVIDNFDLQFLINTLKAGGGSTAIPEPGSMVLLALGGLALASAPSRRRRRVR